MNAIETKQENLMGRGAILPLVVKFSLPAIVGLLANALYNIVDRIFIGHTVGSDGLAAIAVVFPIVLMVSACSSLFGVGAASRVSIALGEKRQDIAQKVMDNMLLLSTAFAALILFAGIYWMDSLIKLSGATSSIESLTKDYLQIVMWGLGLQILINVLNYQIRAEGHPKFAMWTMLLGAFGNVILDWLFIIVMDMGIAGAAWGTLGAQILSFLWILWFYLAKKGTLALRFKRGLDKEIVKYILKVGFSPFLMNIFFAVVMVVFNKILGSLGGELAISAMGIFFSLDSLFFLPVLGIGEGVMPLVGYNYGAGKFDRVKEVAKLSIVGSTIYFLITTVLALTFAKNLVALFNTDNPDLLNLTVRAFYFGYPAMPLAGVTISAGFIFQGLGKAKQSLILSMSRQVIVILGLLSLPKIFGIDGVWATFPMVDIVGFFLAIILLRAEFKNWKQRAAT